MSVPKPKLHGGSFEDLSPELQAILSKPRDRKHDDSDVLVSCPSDPKLRCDCYLVDPCPWCSVGVSTKTEESLDTHEKRSTQ